MALRCLAWRYGTGRSTVGRARCRIDRTRVSLSDRLLTVAETRRALGCCESTVETLVRRGYLEKVPLLSGIRFRESQVAAILENGAPARDRVAS